MTLTYEPNEKMQTLYLALDKYMEWYGWVVCEAFYPEKHDDSKSLDVPEVFKDWLDDVSQNDSVDNITMDHILSLQKTLHQSVSDLLQENFMSAGKPSDHRFYVFVRDYNSFILQLRKLERNCMTMDGRIDISTGLCNAQVMEFDLNREMDRRARGGVSFSLILARVDDYDSICKLHSAEEQWQILQSISEQLQKCMRSFDDLYRLNSSEFILSIKNTDLNGASSAIGRLRRYLVEENIIIMGAGGSTDQLTMSYCLADPMPGDEISALIENMQGDINSAGEGKDRIMEFFEASPLSRYMDRTGDNV